MGKYLTFYKECMKTGNMPNLGLCACLVPDLDQDNLELFRPTYEDFEELAKHGYSIVYWASGLKYKDENNKWIFTPLRQTIVLFLAAMNNEL